MIATQELVVPRSIPITSPASVLFHLLKALLAEKPTDACALLSPPNLEDEVKLAAERRKPNCKALDISLFLFGLVSAT